MENEEYIVGIMEKVRFVCAVFDNRIGEGFVAAMVSVSFLILTHCCLLQRIKRELGGRM
jgi:hypothetical protein